MSDPTRFMILAIVIGIKNIGYVCFVRRLCCVQSIHTELAKLYSKKVIFRMEFPVDPVARATRRSRSIIVFKRLGIKVGLRRLYSMNATMHNRAGVPERH